MKKISFEDTELEYDVFHSANKESIKHISSIEDNIILIHGGIIADANIPLVTFSDSLTKNYNILHYHRRGYGKSINKGIKSKDIFQHVKDCKQIMEYLDIKKAHVVGHSIGGTIALQLASKYPEVIKTLILLEPAITGYNKTTGQQVIQEFEPLIQLYDRGQQNEAIDIFMKNAIGSNYKEIISNVLPSYTFDLAVKDAKTFFHEEIPFMETWTFTKNQAKNLLDKKILHIRGKKKSRKISKDREKLLSYWLPQTIMSSILNAPHMIQITNSKEVIQIINKFLHNINRF
jgi:pimeloyl-ACP methyl ester carboxylesterase